MHLSWAEGTWTGNIAPAVWSWGLDSCSDCMWPLGIYRPFPHDPASLFSILFLCSQHEDREAPQTGIHFLGAPVKQTKVLNWQAVKCETADCNCHIGMSCRCYDPATGTVLCSRTVSIKRHRLTVCTLYFLNTYMSKGPCTLLSITRTGGWGCLC